MMAGWKRIAGETTEICPNLAKDIIPQFQEVEQTTSRLKPLEICKIHHTQLYKT